MACPLCARENETVLWRDDRCRVILAGDADYPGFCRVVWDAHVAEMTDLAAADRAHVLDVVFAVETALRQLMRPDKINLASFGNMVPHLHWHVIPRFRDDKHFPQAVWGPAERTGTVHAPPAADLLGETIGTALAQATR